MEGNGAVRSAIKALLAGSRFMMALAVAATLLGAMAIMIMATLTVLRLVWDEITTFDTARLTARNLDRLGVQVIQITDIILLGTVLYIVGIGLYQLFIDQDLPLPRWLRVHDLITLKRDLIGVTVVLLGVNFLAEVVDWSKGDESIFLFGAAIALVVLALGFIMWLTPKPEDEEGHQTGK